MMKTKVRLFATLVISLLLVSSVTGQIPTVTGFIYPLDEMINGYDLLYGNRDFMSIPTCCPYLGYHLAVDVDQHGVAGAPVRAVASGKVVFFGPLTGYGQLVVAIEHQLPTGIPFINGTGVLNNDGTSINTHSILTIYGHLRNSVDIHKTVNPDVNLHVGDPVYQGEIIGYINDDANNGDGAEHLHFGIRLSDNTVATQRDGGKRFRGNDVGSGMYVDFTDPEWVLRTYLNAIPGVYSDGWLASNHSQAFLDAYLDDGTLGYPINNHPNAPAEGTAFVHYWSDPGPGNPKPGVWIQDLYNPSTGLYSAIILNPNGNAYPVKGPFRDWYTNPAHFGYKELGAPKGKEQQEGSNIVQEFDNGVLTRPIGSSTVSQEFLVRLAGANNMYAPIQLSATNFTQTSVTLAWKDGINLSGTTYKIYRNNGYVASSGMNLYFTDSGPSPNTMYQYKVSAVYNGQESIFSNTVIVGTLPSTNPPNAKGAVTIATDPSGANIYYSGGAFWKTSPIVAESLNAGNYTMVAKKTGYGDIPFDFGIAPGYLTQLNVRLNPASFPLSIEAESMQGTGLQVSDGRKLAGANNWYIFQNFNLPEKGRIEFEVIAKAEWQLNGYWPKLEVAGPVQEISSTDYVSYFYYADYVQGGQFQVNIKQDEWTRNMGGHSIIVDKCILRYVAVPPPNAPSNCVASFNQSTATITWTDNSTNEEGFKIEYQFGSSPNWGSFTAPANAISAQYTAGSPNNELYRFRVKAYVASGAVNSALSNETLAKILGIPSNLAASAVSSSKINLSWTDNSSLEDGFMIERKPSGGSFSEIASTAANATSFSDSVGLLPSTTYYYRIRAFAVSDGTSPHVSNYSNDASVTTLSSVANLIKDPLCNGPFDPNGTNGWTMMDDEQSGTHDVTFSSSSPLSGSSSMLVNNDIATSNWTGIKQKLDLIQGHDYRVSFIVKSDNAGPYSTFVDALSLVDWQGQGAWYSYNVTSTQTVHSYQFNCRSTATSLFAFQFGSVVGNVRADSISVIDLSSSPSNPVLSLSPTILNLGSASAGTLSGSFNISNAGSGTLSWTNTKDGSITVSPSNGTGNATVNVSVNVSGLSLGNHMDYVYVSSNGGDATVNVSYIVTASGGDYTDDPGNLFVNGKANTVTDLSQGPVGSWYAEPRSGSNLVQFTSNALYGPYSLEIVKASAQGGDGDTRILQAVPLQAGKQYRLVALMENSSNISGSASITNFEWGGSWNWQNLWWQQTLSPGKKRIVADFTSNGTGNVAIQFQWGLVTGSTRIDSLIIREKVESALGPNLLTNGDAEDTSDDLAQGVAGSWFGEPTNGTNLVRYTNNAIQGSSSLEVVKGSVQSGEGDTRLMQAPSLQAGKKYRLSFIMDNATGTSGSASITNYQWGGSWNWQNLWWQQSLSSGRQVISLDFIPNVTGDIAIQFQWGLVVGSTRFDSISVKEVALAKSTEPSELDGTLSIPATFQLYQNHPNPFNPTTEFRFDLPERAHGTLTVYNITGQKVATLLDEEIAAGTHRVQWNASNLPSGVYIYELKAGQFLARKKLALVK